MEVTSAAQRQAFARRTIPPIEKVRPGILAIPQEMPELRLPYSLSYLVASDGEAHLIDAGMPSDRNWELLEEGLASVGLGMDDLASVTLTHLHRDHAGLAPRIRDRTSATVRMHAADARAVRSGKPRIDATTFEDALRRWGVPPDAAATLREEVLGMSEPEIAVTVDDEPADGDVLRLGSLRVRVTHTPGHTAGHIALVMDPADDPEGVGIVFTGDHMLPAMSTGLGLGGLDDAFDPLPDYLRAIRRVQTLGDVEVCPGHGYRFRGADERCAEILEHQRRRSAAVAEELRRDPHLTIWELSRALWQDRGWDDMTPHTRFSALGQAAMHAAVHSPPEH